MSIKPYRGYHYKCEVDYEEDNVKIFHSYYIVHDDIEFTIAAIPLSPYSEMTQGLWEMWIQAGRPSREKMGGHHVEHIQRYWRKLYDEALDKILLGEFDG